MAIPDEIVEGHIPAMSRAFTHTETVWSRKEEIPPRRVDLGILGGAIRRLPPACWQPGMLFSGAPDRGLKDLTGEFPATFRSDKVSHPIFVLKTLSHLGHKVCPCSSRRRGTARFIRKGCVLEITGIVTDRDTYLVEGCAFNLPMDPAFSEHLRFRGLVPNTCMERRD